MKGKECSKKLHMYGGVLVRVVLGLIFFLAGYSKLFSSGGLLEAGSSAGIVGMVGWAGGAALLLGWVVAIVEFVGGALFILGYNDKIVASLLAIIMFVAIVTIHWKSGSFLGWWNSVRYPLLMMVMFVSFIGANGQLGLMNLKKMKH